MLEWQKMSDYRVNPDSGSTSEQKQETQWLKTEIKQTLFKISDQTLLEWSDNISLPLNQYWESMCLTDKLINMSRSWIMLSRKSVGWKITLKINTRLNSKDVWRLKQKRSAKQKFTENVAPNLFTQHACWQPTSDLLKMGYDATSWQKHKEHIHRDVKSIIKHALFNNRKPLPKARLYIVFKCSYAGSTRGLLHNWSISAKENIVTKEATSTILYILSCV